MQQKYIYAYNGLFNWIRGLLWVPQKGQLISAYKNQASTMIWRNHYTQNYKIGQAYAS
jgi:hypothetical protein